MQKLQNLDPHESNKIKNDFMNAQKIANYLLKWFDFSENSYKSNLRPYFMSKFKLHQAMNFNETES